MSESEKKPLKMSIILKETVKMLRASIPSTIEIYTDLSAKSDSVFADATQIHQVLMNLCTNAWHAMRGNGTGVLRIALDEVYLGAEALAAHPGLEEGPYLELTVSDTGDGIPAEIMDRVFEPYFTTKERGDGTGLGLALVQGIVRDHGGMVEVSTRLGRGTTFCVFLPQLEFASDHFAADLLPLPRGTGCILCVDDEPVLADIAQKMLGALGYQVIAKTSSLEALDAFRAQPQRFDLVITDLTMPKMTGIDLAKEIIQIRPEIPIILCTGFSQQMTQERAQTIGIREIIFKPIIARELAEAVHRSLVPSIRNG